MDKKYTFQCKPATCFSKEASWSNYNWHLQNAIIQLYFFLHVRCNAANALKEEVTQEPTDEREKEKETNDKNVDICKSNQTSL